MASISNLPNGRKAIQFVDPTGARRTIRLGKMTKPQAEFVRVRVEALVASKTSQSPWEPPLAAWVVSLTETLADRLADVGLIQRRGAVECPPFGSFLESLIAGRTDLKPGTRTNLGVSRARIVEFFKADRDLRSITEGHADDFAVWLKTKEYAAATVARTLKHAREFFKAAKRRNLIAANPFLDVKIPSMVNRTRAYFVTSEDARKVLESCPDAEWRLIFALSRYAGLRCPSEHLNLRWEDIDWARDKIRIRSPKKEGDEDGGERLIPLFPELRGPLADVFELAEDGAEFVITRYRDAAQNLRTQLQRIIRRAGLTPWPRLFQNLRASRETELAAEWPLHVVVGWLGNSARVATAHYLTTTDADFQRAAKGAAKSGADMVQNVVQQGLASSRHLSTAQQKTPGNPGLLRPTSESGENWPDVQLTLTGFEPVSRP